MQTTWAILGFGRHAENVIYPAIMESPSATLHAVGSRDPHTARTLSNENVHVFSQYEDVLACPEVEVVCIALPNHLHAEWSTKALAAGKHVLCEKPAALTHAELVDVVDGASKNGRIFSEAFVYRFHPQHECVQTHISAGEIGEPREFEAHYHFNLDRPDDIRFSKEKGGGGLFDVGCYLIDSCRFLFLDELPTRVSATWTLGAETLVDESAFAQLIFKNGKVAHLSSGCQFGWRNSYSVYGTEGSIHLPSAYRMPRNKKAVVELTSVRGQTKRIMVEPANQFALQVEAFSQWVQGDRAAGERFGDGLMNAKIMDAIRLSAESAREIQLT